MQMVFLPSARDDLGALRRHFHLSGGDPVQSLQQTRQALTSRVLHRFANGPLPGLREVPLPRTPFRLICRFQDDRVEVLGIAKDPSDAK